MPRNNRVNPFGELISTSAHGQFMGNRGVLHNERGELTDKRWTHQQWIICELEFKGRKRPLMSPGCYTELFFLDEATALAAGHRPCWECNRERYNLYKTAWLAGNSEYGFNPKTSIREIDKILHAERVNKAKGKVTWQNRLAELPDGVFISLAEKPSFSYLIQSGLLHQWAPEGYGEVLQPPLNSFVNVLTPKSTVGAIAAGFLPATALKKGTI